MLETIKKIDLKRFHDAHLEFIKNNPVKAKLPKGYELKCPECDKNINSIDYYPLSDVYVMKCKRCNYEKPHPSERGMYWYFIREWEDKQGKKAEWANHGKENKNCL